MKKLPVALLLAGISSLALAQAVTAAPRVVVSVKPIHALVASIMQGVGEPDVILKGAGSPHTYQMSPADAQTLQAAEVVFWIGPEFEKFLEKPIESLGANAKIVELDDAPGLLRLPVRESGTFEPHADHDEEAHGHAENHAETAEGAGDHHHDEEIDNHIWLNTGNAKMLAAEIERTLSTMDPENAPRYKLNLAKLDTELDGLATELTAKLAPVKGKPFIVFHDAYQYFEREFGVNVAGSITVSPESMPGAARISEIHAKVQTLGASCVFAEPQFEPKLVNVVLEGSQSKSGTLDPEAATLKEGPQLYFEMMRGLAGSIADCLSSKS